MLVVIDSEGARAVDTAVPHEQAGFVYVSRNCHGRRGLILDCVQHPCKLAKCNQAALCVGQMVRAGAKANKMEVVG